MVKAEGKQKGSKQSKALPKFIKFNYLLKTRQGKKNCLSGYIYRGYIKYSCTHVYSSTITKTD